MVTKSRARRDALARQAVRLSGWLVLFALGGLIWHLFSQSLPLLMTPDVTSRQGWQLPANEQALLLGDLSQGGPVVTRDRACRVNFYQHSAAHLTLQKLTSIPLSCRHQQQVLRHQGNLYLADLAPSGLLRVAQLQALAESMSQPIWEFSVVLSGASQWQLALSKQWAVVTFRNHNGWQAQWINRQFPAQIVSQSLGPAEAVVALPDRNSMLRLNDKHIDILDRQQNIVQQIVLGGAATFIQAAAKQRSFFVVTKDAYLQMWSVKNGPDQALFHPVWQVKITAKLAQLTQHNSSNGVLALQADGQGMLINSITGEQISTHKLLPNATDSIWYGDSLMLTDNQAVNRWQIHNIEGLTTWRSLWGKLWYEGYEQPQQVWQTTSSSDYQQHKYSLAPLIIGSIKAALLSLLVAVPLALGAAVFSAYFAAQRVRNLLKPAVEMLEAIPSVVIGFIAAVWLAPMAAQLLWSLLILIMVIPVLLAVVTLFSSPILRWFASHRHAARYPVLLLLGLILATGLMVTVIYAIGQLMSTQFAGSGLATLGVNNSTLVVALALGLAISPSIFTLAEDALYNVPQSLCNASFALGASRQQTLQRIVVKVAMPGMISAVILGLGRAFGETMIVLMVTGNTPLADWDLLQSIRALTANLAIELPKAEPGSSHYRILYLTALLLFVFTFAINSLAELLRRRYRKQVGG